MQIDYAQDFVHTYIINRKEQNRMKQITNMGKDVCTMANEIKKSGYSLSDAFKKAWQRVKFPMIVRARGTSFGNRQECLGFLKQFRPDDLSVTLEKEPGNQFDSNAIRIVVHIHPISKKTIIGYVPEGLARELSKVIDTGVEVKAKLLDIIGGYGHKETLGTLVNFSI